MRIGLITGEYPPMEGGVGAFTQELGKALAALGHEIHIISSREARPPLPEGERYSLSQLREPHELPFGVLHVRARRWGWSDVGNIVDVARRHELDVLNIQYQAAAYNMRSAAMNLAPWRLRGLATTVVTFHDLRVPYLFPKAGRLRRMAVNFMARQADGAIVTNEEDRQALAPWLETPLRQIPIGSNIDVHAVSEEEVAVVRRKLRVRPADCLLGYFGFLNESKGADLLLRALKELGEGYQLVFIGGRTGSSDKRNNATFLEELDEMIEELGLQARVHWTGFLGEREVSAHLAAADMMVLPYRDGVSLRRGTLMAALAHGRPVISTEPAVPIPSLREGENIWLVPAADAAALAHAVRKLGTEEELRRRLGSGAAVLAQRFSWQRIAADTEAFFEALRA